MCGHRPAHVLSLSQNVKECEKLFLMTIYYFKKEDDTMENKKILYSVDEVLEVNGGILPLSKSAVYKLIRQQEIPSKRIGKRVFILGTFFEDLRKSMQE